jgi:transposase InsO family protein
VADITYNATWAGFLFLAVVLDAWSRRVVGWGMAAHLWTELVLDALSMAIGQRRPTRVIHHSNQELSVHVRRLRAPLPRSRHPALDGLRRRCLRQCPV